jgi:hypothetical protein
MVSLIGLAEYLDQATADQATAVGNKPGRPRGSTKAARIEATRAGVAK